MNKRQDSLERTREWLASNPSTPSPLSGSELVTEIETVDQSLESVLGFAPAPVYVVTQSDQAFELDGLPGPAILIVTDSLGRPIKVTTITE